MSHHYCPDPDECDAQHDPGARHAHPDSLDTEWTGAAWTIVCPVDDVAVVGRQGLVLACQECGRTYKELFEVAR
jgi:hypothetical protein